MRSQFALTDSHSMPLPRRAALCTSRSTSQGMNLVTHQDDTTCSRDYARPMSDAVRSPLLTAG